MKSHKDLEVWRSAIQLAGSVYQTTRLYPHEERYSITAQMRRCAVSIASNIAEGAARQGDREFLQFLYIALGSTSELDTQIEISKLTGLCAPAMLDQLQEANNQVAKMLQGLIRSVKNRVS